MDHPARIIERLAKHRDARNAGLLEDAQQLVRGALSSRAMMSARGTITSSTRSAPKRSSRKNMSRSASENAVPLPIGLLQRLLERIA